MLNFDVIGATLIEEFGGTVNLLSEIRHGPTDPIPKPENSTKLVLRVKLAEDQRVTISTGERLEKLPGFITIYAHEQDLAEGLTGIGALSYFAQEPESSAPVSYHVQVLLPKTQFQDLITAARFGRVPSDITVMERGMEMPDEFSKKWDINSSPCLDIAAVSFSIPLTPHESYELSPTTFFPPTQLQIRSLLNDITALKEVTRDIAGKMKWLIALVAACAAVALIIKF